MSSGGGGIRNQRKVEQRCHSVHRRSGGGPIKRGTTGDVKVSFPGLEEEVVPHDWHLLRQSVCRLSGCSGERTPHFRGRGRGDARHG